MSDLRFYVITSGFMLLVLDSCVAQAFEYYLQEQEYLASGRCFPNTHISAY